MPYPPEYPKMPGEPKRVQPSKDTRNKKRLASRGGQRATRPTRRLVRSEPSAGLRASDGRRAGYFRPHDADVLERSSSQRTFPSHRGQGVVEVWPSQDAP